jgi:hypothetical protein
MCSPICFNKLNFILIYRTIYQVFLRYCVDLPNKFNNLINNQLLLL